MFPGGGFRLGGFPPGGDRVRGLLAFRAGPGPGPPSLNRRLAGRRRSGLVVASPVMFENFTTGLRGALSFIDRGRLSEANIREGMKQVREALLEADVNYDVAKDFTDRVSEQAVGERVLKALRPSEQIVGIVYQELVRLLGGEAGDEGGPTSVPAMLGVKRDGLTVLMLCGLQGSGKTTTCGKLAKLLQRDGVKALLVAADLQRPAAIEQLKTLGGQLGVPVYSEDPAKSDPVQVCRNGVAAARKAGDVRVVILDTAGRLAIDEPLMRELRQIDSKCGPDAAILVADAMTGQDAVNSAKAFNDALELDAVILTKTDGDTRGGAALSIKAVTGVPLKFVGTGETLERDRAVPPGADGRPHPGRGRRRDAAREGEPGVRRGGDGGRPAEDGRGPLLARRLPQADGHDLESSGACAGS